MVSSFAALAGVGLAAFQVLAPTAAPPQPVNVTVALAPEKAIAIAAAKTDAEPGSDPVAAMANGAASYSAALNDGSGQRYNFADLFDGKPETYLVVRAPDSELNVLVNFNAAVAQTVTAIEYQPPPGADGVRRATIADIMVLPEGQMEASGRPVLSFALQTEPGRQSFAIPGQERGKGLWLRIAAPPGGGDLAVGDFRVIRGPAAP